MEAKQALPDTSPPTTLVASTTAPENSTDLLRERIHCELQTLDAHYEAISIPVIVADKHQNILVINSTAATIFGFTKETLAGKPITNLMPEKFRSSHESYVQKFLKELSETSTTVGSCPSKKPMIKPSFQTGEKRTLNGVKSNGTNFPLEVQISPSSLTSNNSPLIIASLRDRTDEIEFAKLKAKDELNTVETQYSKLLSYLTHELRGVFTSQEATIEAFKEDLRKLESHDLPPEVLQDLQKLSSDSFSSLEEMHLIFNDVLMWKEFKDRTIVIRPESINVNTFLKLVLDSNVVKFRQKPRLSLCLKPLSSEMSIILDPHRLKQILRNFTSNAFKYSESGKVIIGASTTAHQTMRFFVQNEGRSLSQGEQEALFVQTTRYGDEKEKRNIEGTGLGLCLCKKIANACEAQVGYIALEGKGSIFYCDFPMSKSAPLPLAMLEAAPENASTPRAPPAEAAVEISPEMIEALSPAVIVDDVPLNRKVLHRHLVSIGFKSIIELDDGIFLLDRIRTVALKTGLILTDVQMKVMHGPDTMRALHNLLNKEPGTFSIPPAIAISGKELSEKENRLAFFDHTLLKPTSELRLRTAISLVYAKKMKASTPAAQESKQ
jgi:two-component system sensor histidine kinase EvgS